MPTKQVSYNPTNQQTLVQDKGADISAGFFKIGEFDHNQPSDSEGWAGNHTLFDHVQDIMDDRKWDDVVGSAASFPHNFTDMSKTVLVTLDTRTDLRVTRPWYNVGVGKILPMSVEIEPATALPPPALVWASDNTAVATVIATTGIVTGVAPGYANITVNDGTLTSKPVQVQVV